MTEDEVNKVCKQWLEAQHYKYKGILNGLLKSNSHRPTGMESALQNTDVSTATHIIDKTKAYGQVPVPDGYRQVLIDHCGVKDVPMALMWIEAKGSDVGMSQLLEGFIRVTYACYHGGGEGLLAVPDHEYHELLEQEGFLKNVSRAAERRLGLFNAETQALIWLDG